MLKTECEDADDFIEIDDSDDDDVHCDAPPAIDLTNPSHTAQNVKIELLESTAANQQAMDSTRNGTQVAHGNGNSAETNDENVTAIEIGDSMSDVRTSVYENESHAEMNGNDEPLDDGANNQHEDDIDIGGAELDSENEVKHSAKQESTDQTANVLPDVPLSVFDPNTENRVSFHTNKNDEYRNTRRAGPSSIARGNKAKYVGGKRVKCEHCRKIRDKYDLTQHLRIHANGKFVGLMPDSNGLYRCTLCVRKKFPKIGYLKVIKSNY